MIMVTFCFGLAGCSATKTTPTPLPPVGSTKQIIERTLSEARIIPVNNAALSFSIPGLVEEVVAAEGETIAEGDVIARLKGVDKAKAAIAQAELLLVTSQKSLDDFTEKGEIASAEAELALAKARIEQKKARDARESLDFQQVSDDALNNLRATYYLALEDFEEAEDYYEPYKVRLETDLERAAFLGKLSNARLARDQALYNLNKALVNPDADKIAKADARLAIAEAMVEDAQITYDRIKDGPDPDELVVMEAAVRNAKAQLEAARTALADLELAAPFSGTVVSNDLKVGQAVSAANKVMLGDISAWQVETTDITEVDIVKINVGDPVSISLDAIPDLMLEGRVNRIKSIGENIKGDTTYTVYIDVDTTDSRLLWNMKAFVAFSEAE
ncbi:MAG: HlyD family secretion protein [Anaerolineaceae bacterium]